MRERLLGMVEGEDFRVLVFNQSSTLLWIHELGWVYRGQWLITHLVQNP
jgi:hypothetical protein